MSNSFLQEAINASKITVDQTFNKNSTNAQSGKAVRAALDSFKTKEVDPSMMNFMYHQFDAGASHEIKCNGFYMIYCDNAKLKLCKSDGTALINGAKQIQLMAAPSANSPNSTKTFRVTGMYFTGSIDMSNLFGGGGSIGVEGFRNQADTGSYVTADEGFSVSEMVKGEIVFDNGDDEE